MANYIKLNIGGKERGAKVGLGFLQQFTEQENMTLNDLFVKFQNEAFFLVPKMIYHSISFNDKLAGNVIDYTIYDVFDWIDEIGLQDPQVELFSNSFAESINVHFPKVEDEQDQGKKKPHIKRQKN